MSCASSYLSEARRTLALGTPIIVGQVSQMLMGVTDSVMIGRVGKLPLAASSLANALWGTGFMVGIGMLIPVAVLVSRSHGAGRDDEAGVWLRHGMAVAVVIGALCSLVLWSVGGQLNRFGQPGDVVAQIRPYFDLIVFSMVPTLVFQVLRQFAESLGRPWVPMAIMLAGVALNMGLNWVFIYGNLGAPALGLTGAGWATLISRIVGVAVIWIWLRRAPAFHSAWPQTWLVGFEAKRFREMLVFGVPVAGTLLFESGAFTAATVMMGWISATALAAHQIALSCAGFTFMFPLGLSMAVSMRIGRAVGEGRHEALRPIGFGAQLLSGVVMGSFALLFVFFGPLLAAGFVSESEVIRLAGHLLVVAAIFQLGDGSQIVAAGALRGLADVKFPTLITLLAYWGVAIPGGYFAGVAGGFGPVGVWAALAAGLMVAAVLLNLRYARLTGPRAALSSP